MSRTDNSQARAHAAAHALPLPPPPAGPHLHSLRPEQATAANLTYLDRFHATMAHKLPPGTPVAPYLSLARRIPFSEAQRVVSY